MAVIKGMIEKAMSPAIITNYSKILDGLSESFETNMSPNDMTSLIRMQIDDMSPWDIKSNNVTGKGAMKTTYTYRKRNLYVAIPDESSLEAARDMIKGVFEGELRRLPAGWTALRRLAYGQGQGGRGIK